MTTIFSNMNSAIKVIRIVLKNQGNKAQFWAAMSIYFAFYILTKSFVGGAIAAVVISYCKLYLDENFANKPLNLTYYLFSVMGAFIGFVFTFFYEFYFLKL